MIGKIRNLGGGSEQKKYVFNNGKTTGFSLVRTGGTVSVQDTYLDCAQISGISSFVANPNIGLTPYAKIGVEFEVVSYASGATAGVQVGTSEAMSSGTIAYGDIAVNRTGRYSYYINVSTLTQFAYLKPFSQSCHVKFYKIWLEK